MSTRTQTTPEQGSRITTSMQSVLTCPGAGPGCGGGSCGGSSAPERSQRSPRSSCSDRTRIQPPQRFSTTPAQEPERAVKAPLSPEAKRVAMRFIQTAVARENLDEAWNLVGPNLRGGLTKATLDDGREPGRPVPDRQARGRAVQGRRVVRHERAPRDRPPAAQGIGHPRPDLLPRAAQARGGSRGALGGRQLGAARLGGRPPMTQRAREQPRRHQGGGERPGRRVPPRRRRAPERRPRRRAARVDRRGARLLGRRLAPAQARQARARRAPSSSSSSSSSPSPARRSPRSSSATGRTSRSSSRAVSTRISSRPAR